MLQKGTHIESMPKLFFLGNSKDNSSLEREIHLQNELQIVMSTKDANIHVGTILNCLDEKHKIIVSLHYIIQLILEDQMPHLF